MDVQRLTDAQPRLKDQPEQQGVARLLGWNDGKDALDIVLAQPTRMR